MDFSAGQKNTRPKCGVPGKTREFIVVNAPLRDRLTARQKKPGEAEHAGFKRREIRKINRVNA
jgi:hypothetical protein